MKKNEHDVELGDLVRDRVTGFTGIVVVLSHFLSGCDRVSVQPRDLKEGSVRMTEGLDCLQVEILEKAAVIIEAEKRPSQKRPGGPPVYPIPNPNDVY